MSDHKLLRAAEAVALKALEATQAHVAHLDKLAQEAVAAHNVAHQAWVGACIAADQQAPEDLRVTIDGERALITRQTKATIWARVLGARSDWSEQKFTRTDFGGTKKKGFYGRSHLRFGWPEVVNG